MIFSILGHTWVIVDVRVSSILLNLKKDVFSSCHKRGTEKKNWSRHKELHLRPSDSMLQRSEVRFLIGTQNFFLCPTLEKRWKNIFLYFLTKLKTYQLSYFYYWPFILHQNSQSTWCKMVWQQAGFCHQLIFSPICMFFCILCTLKPEAELTLSSKVKRW